jgi:nucleotide-binding universal stress UspA family protein
MKLLVYSDGSPSSVQALRFAAQLTRHLAAELAVITVRSGTHAIEPPPPFGAPVDLADSRHLPPGLQILSHALEVLDDEGLMDRQGVKNTRVSELPNGHLFVSQSRDGKRIPFYVCFGHMIEILNHEIDVHRYDLLIIAPPLRGRLHKIVLGDTTRKLALDLHTSILIVRGGRAQSRFVICTDGSAAAGCQFSMLERFLPVIAHPLELAWVQTPDCDAAEIEMIEGHLKKIEGWLAAHGKQSKRLRLQGLRPDEVIASAAGDDAVIFLGASLRHDLYRRLMGSLPMQILEQTTASVLMVKGLPEDDPNF